MRYLSVCSGIEAATQAWHPLGWSPVAFSEIEPFPCAVLAHHYPTVPNWGDMTKFAEWPDADVDVLCGGTPCQSFSVAGLRRGLADPRGNLMLTFGAIAGRYRPRWLVWENVPGVLSSNAGRDFGAFLGMLGELGYGFAYRVLDAQHVRTRRFPRAVPQRRRRVWVVGYLGDWRRAAAVLFDRESLSGNPPPRREAGEISPTIPARSLGGGGLGTDFDCDGGLILSHDPACTLTARESKGALPEADLSTVIGLRQRALAFDTTQITSAANRSNPKPGDPCHPLAAGAHPPAIAFQERGREGGRSLEYQEDVAYALTAPSGGGRAQERNIASSYAVRRLTPRECERLQGFPDDFTRIPYRGKPAEACPDGPRYKALGNSWAVNCAEWIGERIELVEALEAGTRLAAE